DAVAVSPLGSGSSVTRVSVASRAPSHESTRKAHRTGYGPSLAKSRRLAVATAYVRPPQQSHGGARRRARGGPAEAEALRARAGRDSHSEPGHGALAVAGALRAPPGVRERSL